MYVDDSDINLSLQSVSAIKASIACLPLDSIRAASTGDGHGLCGAPMMVTSDEGKPRIRLKISVLSTVTPVTSLSHPCYAPTGQFVDKNTKRPLLGELHHISAMYWRGREIAMGQLDRRPRKANDLSRLGCDGSECTLTLPSISSLHT